MPQTSVSRKRIECGPNRARFVRGLFGERVEPWGRSSKYVPDVRERALRLVQEHADKTYWPAEYEAATEHAAVA